MFRSTLIHSHSDYSVLTLYSSVNVRLSYRFRASFLWMLSSLFWFFLHIFSFSFSILYSLSLSIIARKTKLNNFCVTFEEDDSVFSHLFWRDFLPPFPFSFPFIWRHRNRLPQKLCSLVFLYNCYCVSRTFLY